MSVKLLTEHHLEFLCLKEGFTGSSESILVKMPHCLKSHVAAQLSIFTLACAQVNKTVSIVVDCLAMVRIRG